MAACLLGSSAAQSRQTSFCDDDAPADLRLKPSPLPQAVIKSLSSTREVREVQQEAKNRASAFEIGSLFKGTGVTLTDTPDAVFLVIGKPPMAGADNTWLWIVRQSGSNAAILLWTGANCLTIERGSKHGFRNIRTDWSSAAVTVTEKYRFNGTAYELTKRQQHPVN